ncbi:hypothetical protein [Haloferax profundi]|uniref:Uncharacterized protein n=1 Tax=Haloferax profundi TaxID=1544718 RepID=A0A0W1R5Q3_9EURY|nr:hypothetical protein [Haloferax profundi]KTG08742.1 hypothetical protein AUR66_20240 [Haloferax profundi]
MVEDEYSKGEVVPVDIWPRNADETARFAVSVEVYSGYGSTKHVYPKTQVESVADIFENGGDRDNLSAGDDVRLYTVPYDDLR